MVRKAGSRFSAGGVLFALAALVASGSAGAQAALGLSPLENAGALHDRPGETFTFVCPATVGEANNVYGTDTYTDSSPICPAAVHAGVLSPGRAGIVTIQVGKGAKAFEGSRRNGITTLSYTAWPYSYVFVGAGATGSIGWSTVWNGIPLDFAEPIAVRCPSGGATAGVVWGTDSYTRDSSICVAAVHAGVIAASTGGVVSVRRAPAATVFPGSRRNGVESQRWGGSYEDVFSVAAAAAPASSALAASSPRQQPTVVLPAVATPAPTTAAVSAPPAQARPESPPAKPLQPARPARETRPRPAATVAPRTIVLAGFAGVGSAPVRPRTIATAGFSGVGSGPAPAPVGARTIKLPGWTGVGSAP